MTRARTLRGQPATPRGRFPARRAGRRIRLRVAARAPPCRTTRSPAPSVDALGTATLDIRAQTRAVIENIRDILRRSARTWRTWSQVTTLPRVMNDFGGYNEVYAEYFDESGPARTTVAVHQLPHPHLLIEMQAVAQLTARRSRR